MSKLLQRAIIVSMACATVSSAALAGPQAARSGGSASPLQVGDFSLLDQNGVFHQMSRERDRKAFVVMSYDGACASDKQAVEALGQVRKKFDAKDVEFLLLNSKLKQDRNAIGAAAKQSGVDFPILMDHAQLVAESFGFKTTGAVAVVDPEKGTVLYKGPVNEQVGAAIEAKLAGKAELGKVLPVQGCAIDIPAKKQ